MRKTLVAALAVAFLQTGCFGSFGLVHGVYGFNKDVSGNKFVRELVFLGMVIIPVYGLATLGDALIFNTIEFWTGDNPVAVREVPLEDGTLATLVREGDGVRVIHGHESWLVERTGTGMRVTQEGRRVSEVSGDEDGATVVGAGGEVEHRADAAELAALERAAMR